MGFDAILGNNRVKQILRLALQKNRIPNSLLFCGPKGVGKRSLAQILAKALNCERLRDDACEECATCRAISGRRLPDVWEIEPEGQVIKVETMRAMRQAAYLRPMVGRKRVFIIDPAERMNDESSNTVLKILEEPPLFSQIILLTVNEELILPTIRSRCQLLHFSPVGKEEISRVLQDKGYPEDRAKIIALYVRGNVEEALNLDWEEVQRDRAQAWAIFRAFLERDLTSSFFRNYGFAPRQVIREGFEKTLEMLATFVRDWILIREGGDRSLLLNPDYAAEIQALGEAWSLEKSWELLRQVEDAVSGLGKNLNVSLLVSSFYRLLGEEPHERNSLSRI
ncbi:MAG: DNA polymerase III subunit delta' [Acidobacteriota bacterium]